MKKDYLRFGNACLVALNGIVEKYRRKEIEKNQGSTSNSSEMAKENQDNNDSEIEDGEINTSKKTRKTHSNEDLFSNSDDETVDEKKDEAKDKSSVKKHLFCSDTSDSDEDLKLTSSDANSLKEDDAADIEEDDADDPSAGSYNNNDMEDRAANSLKEDDAADIEEDDADNPSAGSYDNNDMEDRADHVLESDDNYVKEDDRVKKDSERKEIVKDTRDQANKNVTLHADIERKVRKARARRKALEKFRESNHFHLDHLKTQVNSMKKPQYKDHDFDQTTVNNVIDTRSNEVDPDVLELSNSLRGKNLTMRHCGGIEIYDRRTKIDKNKNKIEVAKSFLDQDIDDMIHQEFEFIRKKKTVAQQRGLVLMDNYEHYVFGPMRHRENQSTTYQRDMRKAIYSIIYENVQFNDRNKKDKRNFNPVSGSSEDKLFRDFHECYLHDPNNEIYVLFRK